MSGTPADPRHNPSRHPVARAGLAALGILLTCACMGCSAMPKGAVPVTGFQKERYLGKWYEIARLDHVFERNMDNVYAEYTVAGDGFIGVTNRGYNYRKHRWQEAKGKARFRGSDTVGALEVSFFGPIYGAYNIIALDPDYKYALVAGNSRKYLWILSREKQIPAHIKDNYLQIAGKLGFDVGKLIWVRHDEGP